jgi:DNA polymerase-3 subunit delta'
MFSDFPAQLKVTQLLQRSLERHRLAHAYLFTGNSLTELEKVARTLAKTLNCLSPRRSQTGMALDCCDQCDSCRRIDQANHPDVLVLRPESKSRIVTIDQVRQLMKAIYLKPSAGEYKVGIIVAADRLNIQAANAFLKTLEEPPPKSILILLSTEPQRLLETILSRCLRLCFAGDRIEFDAEQVSWLENFTALAADGSGGLLGRYRLLSMILNRLAEQRTAVEKKAGALSPLERYDDLEPRMREKLEDELAGAIEAEYRRQRTEVIGLLHWWLRDIWLQTLALGGDMVSFANLTGAAQAVARRISSAEAISNLEVVDRLQRQLHTNVQEALALEVGLLKLKL